MPRIRWPVGSEAHTNAVLALQEERNPSPSGIQPSPAGTPTDPAPKPAATQKRKSTGPAPEPAATRAHKSAKSAAEPPAAKKRKSTGSVPGSAATKRLKESALTTPSPASKKAKAPDTKSATNSASKLSKEPVSELLDVSGDTCDTVRSKIVAILDKDGVSKAAFMRASIVAAYGPDSGKYTQWTALSRFLSQSGALSGNTTAIYYASYVFFEKLRIKQGKPKSADREKVERLHSSGLYTKRSDYVNGTEINPSVDKHGRIGAP
ncbi:hypothetical protein B0T16DRAFT_460872 [Cercophora newfieldiana]|uniref:DUF7726 domain-containing protein n=1 Tax=Cercophora newfieldiana TaxID=92897 RepID=A0AA40CKT3_9PEZI|nr:hypothetical protein B0T16DRAFT_460872 [Cercophora newfieldiana]